MQALNDSRHEERREEFIRTRDEGNNTSLESSMPRVMRQRSFIRSASQDKGSCIFLICNKRRREDVVGEFVYNLRRQQTQKF
jgi:hypothetical protein